MQFFACFIFLFVKFVSAHETKQVSSVAREPKIFGHYVHPSPPRHWNLGSPTENYRPPLGYTEHKPDIRPYSFLGSVLKKISEWKRVPYYEPYYIPYVISKPSKPTMKTTTTTTTTKAPEIVLSCECGVSNPATKIIGGTETSINKYPWMVALCNASPCNLAHQFCGGALINDRYILTAGHCLDPNIGNTGESIFVSLGDHDLNSDTETTSIEIEAEEIITHPGFIYNTSEVRNDIGLIKLATKPMISNTVRPICLPVKDGNTYAGDLATVSGWGYTKDGSDNSNVLLEVSVAVLNNDACSNRLDGFEIPETQVCAGGMGEDSCEGDSGGPLVTEKDDNKFEQIGIVSAGFGCGVTPGIYTRVTEYLDWIEENTRGALYCASK